MNNVTFGFFDELEKLSEEQTTMEKIVRHFKLPSQRPEPTLYNRMMGKADTDPSGYHGDKYLSGLGGAAAGALAYHLIRKMRKKNSED